MRDFCAEYSAQCLIVTTDTILTQSLLDRLLYTGTIQLVTAGSISTGSALFAKHRFAGIMLEFVPEPEKNFAKIQQFIHK